MEEVEIPGGKALMRTARSEMTARQRRPIELLASGIGRKLDEIQGATRLVMDGEVVLDQSSVKTDDGEPKFVGGDIEVTRKQLGLIMEMNDLIALSLLKSWTLDLPLPRDIDDYLDLPMPIYEALRVHAARINTAMRSKPDEFTVDAIEDRTSPTGG